MHPNIFKLGALLIVMTAPAVFASSPPSSAASPARPSLQALIDANPGGIIRIPAGEYTITAALRLTSAGTELYGPARIVQANPDEPMMRIENTSGIRVFGLSFTRAGGKQHASQAGIDVIGCRDVELDGLRVSENHTHTSIRVRDSRDVTVAGCTITNYKGPTIDDRTQSPLSGYAFKSIDGTGIQMLGVAGAVIRDNRIEELRLWPTREVRDRYDLGKVTVMPKQRGLLMDPDVFNSQYTHNWHQGAGIQVSGPEVSRRVIITGNSIFHPAQGLDLHCDNVIVANNIISYAMIGMKAMHGAKNVLIDGNQFMYTDLWGLLLMPGSLSHRSANASAGAKAVPENVDGGTIVSNNIFSDFGFGDQYWNWVDHHNDYPERNVIAVLMGQLAENPPLHDVLITGNVVYDSGQDTMLLDGKWVKAPPRYFYALYVEQKKQPAPVNVKVYGNLFDPGMSGASNVVETKASGR